MRRVICISVLAFVLCACDSSVRDQLKESQADDIVALLDQQGIKATKKKNADGTWAVKLIEGREADVARVLHQYGVPKEKHAGIVDLFPGDSLFPTELEERARYQFALGQELARTLESIDGVLSARVHVHLPEKASRQVEGRHATASVFVRHRSDQRIDLMKSQIRSMVARALPGTRMDDVSVLTIPVYPTQREDFGRSVFGWKQSGWLGFWLVLPWLAVGVLVYLLGRRGKSSRWREYLSVDGLLRRGRGRDRGRARPWS